MLAPGFLESLDEETRLWFAERSSHREFRDGQTLFLEGDTAHATYVIVRGLVRIERVVLSGQRQVLTLAGRGEVVGELSVLQPAPRSASAVAMVDTEVVVIPASAMEHALLNFPDVPLGLARRLADRLRTLTDQLLEATSGTALTRVAARILQMLDPEILEGRAEVGIAVSQSELAAWAGLSREGTVKAISVLREQGVLQTSRRHITVLDVRALREAASSL